MRRIAFVVSTGVMFLMVSVLPALADSALTPPQVGGKVVRPPGGSTVAFTGASITLGVLLAAALLVVGVTLLIFSRRRAHAAE